MDSSGSAVTDMKPLSRSFYTKADLASCADGRLFGEGNARLPAPPLQMIDRVIDLKSKGGKYNLGYAHAELDVEKNQWFFHQHFKDDPLMPGCFLLESVWQTTGFLMAWQGYEGRGRVIDSGRACFREPIQNVSQTLFIEIHIKKIRHTTSATICVADGLVQANKAVACRVCDLKLALVKNAPEQNKRRQPALTSIS